MTGSATCIPAASTTVPTTAIANIREIVGNNTISNRRNYSRGGAM